MGTYSSPPPKVLGNFTATPGWDDVWAQKRVDMGNFYASKDNEYPTLGGGQRRINWGWATVPPASTQTLPREVTFNAEARTLQQYPIKEIESLRGAATPKANVPVNANTPADMGVAHGQAKTSETLVTFELPATAATFGVSIGKGGANPVPTGTKVGTFMKGIDMPGDDYNITHFNVPDAGNAQKCEAMCTADTKCKSWTFVVRGAPAGSGDCCLKAGISCPNKVPSCTSGAKVATTLSCGGGAPTATTTCTVAYTPPANKSAALYTVPVTCGAVTDQLTLLATEKTLEIRIFADMTFFEASAASPCARRAARRLHTARPCAAVWVCVGVWVCLWPCAPWLRGSVRRCALWRSAHP